MTRTALVTGASRGIGLAVATMLAREAYGLTVAARDPRRLADVARALKEAGAPQVVTCAGDMTEERHVAELSTAHREAFGTMNVLMLNAGVGTAGRVESYPIDRLDKMLAVNVRAPLLLVKDCLPMLRQAASADPSRGARVIAMASLTGVFAEAGLAAYGATKAALISLIDTVNVEESGHGVSATALAPGYVDTDMSAWITGSVPAESMIPASDIAVLVNSLITLSARSVIPKIVVTRAGTSGLVA
jgi:3-oxoacyl-[acyl-carrier protein] reductase